MPTTKTPPTRRSLGSVVFGSRRANMLCARANASRKVSPALKKRAFAGARGRPSPIHWNRHNTKLSARKAGHLPLRKPASTSSSRPSHPSQSSSAAIGATDKSARDTRGATVVTPPRQTTKVARHVTGAAHGSSPDRHSARGSAAPSPSPQKRQASRSVLDGLRHKKAALTPDKNKKKTHSWSAANQLTWPTKGDDHHKQTRTSAQRRSGDSPARREKVLTLTPTKPNKSRTSTHISEGSSLASESPAMKAARALQSYTPVTHSRATSSSAGPNSTSSFFGTKTASTDSGPLTNNDVHFRNLGNTCYINAVLQVILRTPCVKAQLQSAHWVRALLAAKKRQLRADPAHRTTPNNLIDTGDGAAHRATLAQPTTTERPSDDDSAGHADAASSSSNQQPAQVLQPRLYGYLCHCLCRLGAKHQLPIDLQGTLSYLRAKSALVRQIGVQQDAQEFLSEFTEIVDNELLGGVQPLRSLLHGAAESWPDDQLSPFGQLLHSSLQMTLECTTCGHERHKLEDYRCFSLALNSSASSDSSGNNNAGQRSGSDAGSPINLEQLIQNMLSSETVELRCERCEGGSCAVRKEFASLPQLLAIQLKRFSVDFNTGVSTKNFVQVRAPHSLRLGSPTLQREAVEAPVVPAHILRQVVSAGNFADVNSWDNRDASVSRIDFCNEQVNAIPGPTYISQPSKANYSLKCVIHHSGINATSGHYVTDVWDGASSQWTRFNDSTSTKLSEYGHRGRYRDFDSTSYMFFYERKL